MIACGLSTVWFAICWTALLVHAMRADWPGAGFWAAAVLAASVAVMATLHHERMTHR